LRHKNRTHARVAGRGGVWQAFVEAVAAHPELGGIQVGVQKGRPGVPESTG
jgi:hypothetical protein